MAANPQLTPVVLPSFPTSLRAGSGATYSPYSPSRFHIDKRCQHRCSWKCCSLALIFLCVILTGMLAYFGGEFTASSRIQVEQIGFSQK